MVCYARPGSRLAAIVFVAWLVFARPVSHFFNTAALMTAVTVATAGAVVAATLVFAAFMSTRRRRAAAGGCVSCQFRCQHAMTEPARRLWLVTTADRRPPGSTVNRSASAPRHPGAPGRPGPGPARSVSVLLPMPTVRADLAAPRWPDRPALRASQGRRGYMVKPMARSCSRPLSVMSAGRQAGIHRQSIRTSSMP